MESTSSEGFDSGMRDDQNMVRQKDMIYTTTIIGNYGNFNLGDETLLKQIVENIRNEEDGLHNMKFYVPTRNPEFVTMYHDDLRDSIFPVDMRDVFGVARILLRSNKILIGGGGIWSGFTGPIAHAIPILAIVSKLLGKKVEFISVGIYDTASFLDIFLVNLAFLIGDQSSVRDEESFKEIAPIQP